MPITKSGGIERWNPQKFANNGIVIGKRNAQSINVFEIIFSILSRTSIRMDGDLGFEGELLAFHKGPLGMGPEKVLHYRIFCPANSAEHPRIRYSQNGNFDDAIDSEEAPRADELLRATCNNPDI